MWKDLTEPWRECLKQAWKSYKKGTFPIGAVITNESGTVIASGRNKVYENKTIQGQICSNKIAHAEINAILKINNLETNTETKNYTIYSTMEPCPLCFGAIVMSGIRTVNFGARDQVAGGTNLVNGNEYIASKSMKIEGPFLDIELFQFVLKTDFTIRRGHHVERLLNSWENDCPIGVAIGRDCYETNKLQEAVKLEAPIEVIYDELMQEASLRN
ncbi:nucleoside deaminase [Bacillus sp. BGMRC 2118]|nr:nucleoside deaminase [Bacillus sp. BGMRC 2118]